MYSNSKIPHYILTVDIGGSHITSGICDMKTYNIINKSITRLDVICQGTADDILSTWFTAIQETMEKVNVEICGLAFAIPGPFDYINGISYIKNLTKYDSLYGIDIRKYFSDKLDLQLSQIKFRNDAEAILIGEVLKGAGAEKHIEKAIGLTLGTGFGSAFFNLAETVDMSLYCFPFKEGIADEFFSTRWFQKKCLELSGKHISGVKDLIKIEDISLTEEIFEEFATNLSKFMKEHLHKLKPDILILGGNIAKSANHFLPQLKVNLNFTSIKIATLGENAALVGAANLLKIN